MAAGEMVALDRMTKFLDKILNRGHKYVCILMQTFRFCLSNSILLGQKNLGLNFDGSNCGRRVDGEGWNLIPWSAEPSSVVALDEHLYSRGTLFWVDD